MKASNASADVTLYQVSNQNVTQYVGGGGIVFPNQRVDISYAAVERVIAIFVKAGDHVNSGQSLLQLDPTQLNAQITEASNEVASAQAFLNSVSATGNSVTVAQAQQAYTIAKGKYNSLVAQLSSFTLHNGKLVAPFSGVVTAINVNPSQIFTADMPLITIMDESTVIVHAEVPLMSLGQVHPGQKATVTPSALPNLNMTGTVSSIIPQADPQTDTYEVWVSIPNQNYTLLSGMSAFVRIQENSIASVVPRLAVLNTDRESAVFVVRHQHAYLQRVHLAGRSASTMYVDSGITTGDQVVLVGLDSIQDGQQVRVRAVERKLS
ncbi:MAG: efflux RND transporter periplasmic adaptor subunit [Ktedonobacteraceae bacterium]